MKDIEGVLRAIIPAMESDTHSQYAEAIKETAWLGTVSPWKNTCAVYPQARKTSR